MTVRKKKATFYLPEDLLRATRVHAARTDKRESQVVEEALRALLGYGAQAFWEPAPARGGEGEPAAARPRVSTTARAGGGVASAGGEPPDEAADAPAPGPADAPQPTAADAPRPTPAEGEAARDESSPEPTPEPEAGVTAEPPEEPAEVDEEELEPAPPLDPQEAVAVALDELHALRAEADANRP